MLGRFTHKNKPQRDKSVNVLGINWLQLLYEYTSLHL